MKKIKTLVFVCFLFILTGQSYAQATLNMNDLIGTWTGTGSDGANYTLVLGDDGMANLSSDLSGSSDVVRWKLHTANDVVIYSRPDHATMMLVTDAPSPTLANSSQSLLTNVSDNKGALLKSYNCDMVFDPAAGVLVLGINFRNPPDGTSSSSAVVKISFTK